MHQQFLLQALELAQQRQGFCAPNPAVGCVLVKAEAVIASGAHMACGEPHAEVNALTTAGYAARGAEVYVTLEPCSHQGKTPPCVDALIAAGVAAVYFAVADPNAVASGGAEKLRQAGIRCEQVNVAAITEFYQPYINWVKTGKAQLTAKLAVSLDGKYAIPGEQALITNNGLAVLTAEFRLQHDVIVTSINTVLSDDPALNVRLAHHTIAKPVIVLDPLAELPLTSMLFKTAKKIIVLHVGSAPADNISALTAAGVHCENSAANNETTLSATNLPAIIGKLGFHTAWIETGATWLASFIEAAVLTKLYLYYGNKILGTAALPIQLPTTDWLHQAQNIAWQTVGDEVYCGITL